MSAETPENQHAVPSVSLHDDAAVTPETSDDDIPDWLRGAEVHEEPTTNDMKIQALGEETVGTNKEEEIITDIPDSSPVEEITTSSLIEQEGDDIPDWLKSDATQDVTSSPVEPLETSLETSEKTSSEEITPPVKEEEGQKD